MKASPAEISSSAEISRRMQLRPPFSVASGNPLLSLACLLVVLLACWRIVGTYTQLTQTSDEPAHVACGMELLTHRTYTYETQHPPVARVMAALPLYLIGLRSRRLPDMMLEGNAILNSGDYQRNLALARLGVLPFFLVVCAVIYLWTYRSVGEMGAFWALVIFTTMPAVLAHAGLATTDMAAAASVAGAVLMFWYWRENPNARRSAAFGAVLGTAVLTKFSVPGFLLIAFLITWWIQRSNFTLPRISTRSLKWCAAVMLLTMWAWYGFSTASVFSGHPRAAANLADKSAMLYAIASSGVPLAQVPSGIAELMQHLREGHATYLLGAVGSKGSPLFFPIAVAVKTPITALLFVFAGLTALLLDLRRTRRFSPAWLPVLIAAAILLSCIPGRINIGVRHVLPIYPMLAIVAAIGVIQLWRLETRWQPAVTAGLVLLLTWQIGSAYRARPDYLTYFNELGGREPQRILVDSDFDWGQDVGKLRDWCIRNRVHQLAVAFLGKPDLQRLGLPRSTELRPFMHASGTIAIGESRLRLGTDINGTFPKQGHGGYDWLLRYTPVAVIGKTIRVYQIPAPGSASELKSKDSRRATQNRAVRASSQGAD
ncbi:MAG TPA: hypothetical protein VN577_13785 [Terriglobales bacterium]|nr:hypothetical protein [Terriglobales bacterium]